jgi:hypothetical protein
MLVVIARFECINKSTLIRHFTQIPMSTLVLLVKLAGDIRGTLLLVIASIIERGIGLIWIDFISLKAVCL